MRLTPLRLTAAVALFCAMPAAAQTPLTGSTGQPTTNAPPLSGTSAGQASPALPSTPATPSTRTRRPRRTLAARFDAANTAHDGHLTLDQARAGLPSVARDFAQIDKTNKGYVTIDDIRTHARERRAARRSQRQPQ